MIAYVAAVIPAAVMAISQPVWSLIDEAPNADFIIQLSHGVYPVADATLLDAETVRVLKDEGFFSPLYQSAAGPETAPAPDPTDTGPIPPGLSDRANAAWMRRHIWELSRESNQTPLYYVLMAPVWWVADRLGGPYAAIYVIRLVGALIIATLAPMAVAVSRILAPARRGVTSLAALFAILLPGLDFNGTRISNDALAVAVGGLFVLLALRWAGSPWTWRRTVLMGLVLGVGLMVKLTLVGLFPALGLSALWPAVGSTPRGRFARLVLAGAIAVVCLGPWLLLNVHSYGAVLPGERLARVMSAVPGSFTLPWVGLDLGIVELTYWVGEPLGALPLALPFAVLGGIVALMLPAGVIRELRGRASGAPAAQLVVAVVASAGMIVVALTLLPATFRLEVVGAGRYAYPALPAGAALSAIGMSTVLTSTFVRRAVAAIYTVMAVGILGAGAAGLPATPAPTPGTGMPPPDSTVVSVSASGELQGLTISIDRIALDTHARATWFHLSATNAGSAEVDWPVVPAATSGGVPVHVDYAKSTHLPGDIDAGQTVNGWLFVALDPAGIHGRDLVQMQFADVAVDGYRTVEDVNVLVDFGS